MMKKEKEISKGKKLSITECLPDDPIYKRGWIIGGTYSRRSSQNKSLKSRSPEIQEFLDTQLPQEVREQMSGEYPSAKTDKPDDSSSTDKKKKSTQATRPGLLGGSHLSL